MASSDVESGSLLSISFKISIALAFKPSARGDWLAGTF